MDYKKILEELEEWLGQDRIYTHQGQSIINSVTDKIAFLKEHFTEPADRIRTVNFDGNGFPISVVTDLGETLYPARGNSWTDRIL